jgi:hypothetical protein
MRSPLVNRHIGSCRMYLRHRHCGSSGGQVACLSIQGQKVLPQTHIESHWRPLWSRRSRIYSSSPHTGSLMGNKGLMVVAIIQLVPSSGKAQDLSTGKWRKRVQAPINAQWLSRVAEGRDRVVIATDVAVHAGLCVSTPVRRGAACTPSINCSGIAADRIPGCV